MKVRLKLFLSSSLPHISPEEEGRKIRKPPFPKHRSAVSPLLPIYIHTDMQEFPMFILKLWWAAAFFPDTASAYIRQNTLRDEKEFPSTLLCCRSSTNSRDGSCVGKRRREEGSRLGDGLRNQSSSSVRPSYEPPSLVRQAHMGIGEEEKGVRKGLCGKGNERRVQFVCCYSIHIKEEENGWWQLSLSTKLTRY